MPKGAPLSSTGSAVMTLSPRELQRPFPITPKSLRPIGSASVRLDPSTTT
jgi:hypothetical protein